MPIITHTDTNTLLMLSHYKFWPWRWKILQTGNRRAGWQRGCSRVTKGGLEILMKMCLFEAPARVSNYLEEEGERCGGLFRIVKQWIRPKGTQVIASGGSAHTHTMGPNGSVICVGWRAHVREHTYNTIEWGVGGGLVKVIPSAEVRLNCVRLVQFGSILFYDKRLTVCTPICFV